MMDASNTGRGNTSRPLSSSVSSSDSSTEASSTKSTVWVVHTPYTLTASSPLETVTSWFSGKKQDPPVERSNTSSIHDLASSTFNEIKSSPAAVAGLSAVSATGLTLLSVVIYRKYIRRIRNADYVTSRMVQERKWIKGVVTR